jgi:hypothetical protein
MAAIGAATATAATRGTTIKLTKTNRGKILTTAPRVHAVHVLLR